MITPRFTLNQDSKTLTIVIRAPYCSLSDLDISVEENIFIFLCRPYYLRLHLPGSIEENDETRSSFNSDVGEFTFQYEKTNPDEHFSDLEFITKFLSPKIEVEEGDRKIELVNEQELVADSSTENPDVEYGFAMRGGYNFKALNFEFKDLFEVDPFEIALTDRQKLRHEKEIKQFDPDHYCADLMDSEEVNEICLLKLPWKTLSKVETDFSEQELDFLKDLPNVNYNLNLEQIKYCHNGLLEILYAYCYDFRTTCFEATCESGWTISKLSATLCWFEGFSNSKEVLVCAFRRSLIYPLYRNFKLSQQILEDLKILVKMGEQFIIKCLIKLYNIFITGDSCRYVYNNLFIKDYIIYIMKWDKDLWKKTLEQFDGIKISKQDLGLNLLQIEEDISSSLLNVTMANLNIKEDLETDSDDLTTSESSSASESESESSD